MKKITAILLSALLLLTVCFGCGNSNNDIYIGEGKMTLIRSLITANGFIADEIFGSGFLAYDASQSVTQGSQTFAPVVSEKISTYAELESLIRSTYVESVAEKLLDEPKKYVEIDGKLYIDLQYARTEEAEYDWSAFETQLQKVNEDGSYLLKVKLKKTNGFKTTLKINVSDEDGMLRLCDFYGFADTN